MVITGYLEEYSLSEIFQFLEQGHKTGRLTIVASSQRYQPPRNQGHYIWFREGLVVAAANRTDGQGLSRLIQSRGWLGDRAIFHLVQYCAPGTPFGLYLKSRGFLAADQLKLLFYTQVMRQICALFSVENGSFQFDSEASIPNAELTGLKGAPANEITLAGLRALRNWSPLADKLPDPHSSLVSTISGQPTLRLKAPEWQIWEFTDGQTPLYKIAECLNLTIEKVQQTAFRLIVVGIMEELPLLGGRLQEDPPEILLKAQPIPTQEMTAFSRDTEPSPSFLKNLVSFLKEQLSA